MILSLMTSMPFIYNWSDTTKQATSMLVKGSALTATDGLRENNVSKPILKIVPTVTRDLGSILGAESANSGASTLTLPLGTDQIIYILYNLLSYYRRKYGTKRKMGQHYDKA